MASNSVNGGSFLVRHRGWLIGLAILVGVILLAAFVSLNRGEVPVRAATVTRTTIRSTISTNGKIEPVNNFEAHAPAPTTVRRLAVHEGQQVQAGQLLVQLDDSDARAQAARALAQLRGAESEVAATKSGGSHEEVLTTQSELVKARTDLATAQRNLDALRRLQQKGAASAGEVHNAEAQVDNTQAQLNLLQQKLKDRYSSPEVAKVQAQEAEARAAYEAAEDILRRSNVRAPGAGIVYSLPVRQGVFVNTGDLLVQVANLSIVAVHTYVDEPDIARLKPGEKVMVSWDAMPGRVWQGTVTQVPVEIKKLGTRNVGDVTCEINNSDLKLLPNVNISVSIVTAEHPNVLTLPREAVHQEGGKPYVFEIVNGALKHRDVEVIISNLTQSEISGISQDAVVALGALNAQPLRPGLQVRVVQ